MNITTTSGRARLQAGLNLGQALAPRSAGVPYIRNGSQVMSLITADGSEIPINTRHLDIVVVGANPAGKVFSYFDKPWTPGSNAPPTCWSWDGRTPHKDVPEPVSRDCRTCPKHAWGSRVNSQTGQEGRACGEFYCLAVICAGDPENRVWRLVIKSGSFRAFNEYIKSLGSRDISQVVTRLTLPENNVYGFAALCDLTPEIEASMEYVLDDERIDYVRYIVGEIDDAVNREAEILPPKAAVKALAAPAYTNPFAAVSSNPFGTKPTTKTPNKRPVKQIAVEGSTESDIPAYLRKPAVKVDTQGSAVNGSGMQTNESDAELDARLDALNLSL